MLVFFLFPVHHHLQFWIKAKMVAHVYKKNVKKYGIKRAKHPASHPWRYKINYAAELVAIKFYKI